jgi:hypothetical protein
MPIFFPTGPQIAAGETAKHRRATGLSAFALQGLEDFLYRIHQRTTWRLSP